MTIYRKKYIYFDLVSEDMKTMKAMYTTDMNLVTTELKVISQARKFRKSKILNAKVLCMKCVKGFIHVCKFYADRICKIFSYQ